MSNAARKTDRVTVAPLAGRSLGTNRRVDRSHASAADGGRVDTPTKGDPTRVGCFVGGPENELLVAAVNRLIAAIGGYEPTRSLAAVAELPSPIVLVGPNGSGKTHLARGLAELWFAKHGPEGAAYYTAGDFAREFAAAIADGRVREFRRLIRRRRLVVIDDAHRLGDTEHKAAELRHTLDAVGGAGGLVLLTCTGPLADTTRFPQPLLSRLASGLPLEIAPLGLEGRRELLRQAAEAAGCKLDDTALETLAEQLPPEPPRVLRAASELRRRQGTKVDRVAAQRLIDDDRPSNSPPLREILRVVSRYHKVPLTVLTSASRKQGVVAARAVAIYLARELTPLSYADIGKLLGGRDHTTVMHNYRRITRELPKDRALQSAVDDLKRLLAPA